MSKDAKCTVSFFDRPLSNPENYHIIATDYTSYSMVYSCQQMGESKKEMFWLLQRQLYPLDDNTMASMKKTLSNVSEGYNWDEDLDEQGHDGCRYEWGIKESSWQYKLVNFFM